MSGWYRPYTERELGLIRRLSEHRTDADIAAALGRSPSSIAAQRRKMGILRGDHARIAALEAALLELLRRVQELECKRPRYPTNPQADVHRIDMRRAV